MFNKPRFFSRDINATFAGINHDGYGSMWISLRSSRKKKKKRKREEIERGFYNLPCETESVSNVTLTFAIISRM